MSELQRLYEAAFRDGLLADNPEVSDLMSRLIKAGKLKPIQAESTVKSPFVAPPPAPAAPLSPPTRKRPAAGAPPKSKSVRDWESRVMLGAAFGSMPIEPAYKAQVGRIHSVPGGTDAMTRAMHLGPLILGLDELGVPASTLLEKQQPSALERVGQIGLDQITSMGLMGNALLGSAFGPAKALLGTAGKEGFKRTAAKLGQVALGTAAGAPSMIQAAREMSQGALGAGAVDAALGLGMGGLLPLGFREATLPTAAPAPEMVPPTPRTVVRPRRRLDVETGPPVPDTPPVVPQAGPVRVRPRKGTAKQVLTQEEVVPEATTTPIVDEVVAPEPVATGPKVGDRVWLSTPEGIVTGKVVQPKSASRPYVLRGTGKAGSRRWALGGEGWQVGEPPVPSTTPIVAPTEQPPGNIPSVETPDVQVAPAPEIVHPKVEPVAPVVKPETPAPKTTEIDPDDAQQVVNLTYDEYAATTKRDVDRRWYDDAINYAIGNDVELPEKVVASLSPELQEVVSARNMIRKGTSPVAKGPFRYRSIMRPVEDVQGGSIGGRKVRGPIGRRYDFGTLEVDEPLSTAQMAQHDLVPEPEHLVDADTETIQSHFARWAYGDPHIKGTSASLLTRAPEDYAGRVFSGKESPTKGNMLKVNYGRNRNVTLSFSEKIDRDVYNLGKWADVPKDHPRASATSKLADRLAKHFNIKPIDIAMQARKYRRLVDDGARPGHARDYEAPAFTITEPVASVVKPETPAPVAPKTEPVVKTFEERKAEVRARAAARGGVKGKQAGAILGPEDWADLFELGKIYVEEGVTKFRDWSAKIGKEVKDIFSDRLTKEQRARLWAVVNDKAELPQEGTEPELFSGKPPPVTPTEPTTPKKRRLPRVALRPEHYESVTEENSAYLMDVAQKAITQNAEGGPRTFEKVEAMAKELGFTEDFVKSLPSKGIAYTDAQLTAIKSVMETLNVRAQRATALAAQYPTEQNKTLAAIARQEHLAVALKTFGAESEAGRALNSVKMMYRALDMDARARVARVEVITNAVMQEPKPTVPKSPQRPPKVAEGFGEKNAIFTRARMEAAQASLAKKFGRLSAGVDPGVASDLAQIMGFYIEGGVRSFSQVVSHIKAEWGSTFDDDTLKAAWKTVGKQAREAGKRGKTPAERTLKAIRKNLKLDDDDPQMKAVIEEIAQIDPTDKMAMHEYNRIISKHIKQTLSDQVLSAVNTPKAALSGLDVSAPGRQGLYATLTHPFMGAKAFQRQLSALATEPGYARAGFEIAETPNYEKALMSGVNFSDADVFSLRLNDREEAVATNLISQLYSVQTEKMKPGIGKAAAIVGKKVVSPYRGSERAYVTYLNSMRAGLFNHLVQQAERNGLDFTNANDFAKYEAIAKFVNVVTGRGDISHSAKTLKVLNTFMFSPRLVAARLRFMFDPTLYMKLPPGARRAAALDTMKFATVLVGALKLAQLAGAEVSFSPTDTDFMKIKSGDTRWDITGGHAQFIREAARASSQLWQHSRGVKDPEFKSLNSIGRFARYKLSPSAGFLLDAYLGKTAVGEKFVMKDAALDMIIPLIAQDFMETYSGEVRKPGKSKAERVRAAAVKAAPALLGVGVQDYPPKRKKVTFRMP